MNNQSKLANRFREVILNGTWIANTNFKNELNNLDWKIAVEKYQNLNSIAILAQHIHYYIEGLKNVFLGANLEISDKYSFDFLQINSQEEWGNFLAKFWADSEEFAELIEKLTEEKLNENFVKEQYGTYFRNVDAMIEHSYYHLGQIVLIKKISSNLAEIPNLT
ncbi:DUF1572 family protein [Flavobacterium aquicola]|uniref:Uncharacterized protein DUF1572 n=1 Tax=Flavobacterium aquicola TaxID=1682742 RepID=A0A3E0ERU9_9FLAO|nr:DUF1572 family protein [Flavobacterium aquicola]REH00975.1 uncharacterized protein DUF1572 [Flavobacterium aquicola]